MLSLTGNNSLSDSSDSDDIKTHHQHYIDDTIKHVIRHRLFSTSSSVRCTSSSSEDECLPSVTKGRVKPPQNRSKPSRRER